MNKLVIAAIYENKLYIYIYNEGQLQDQKEFIAPSLSSAAFEIKDYLHRRTDNGFGNIVLVVDQEARFFRLRSEQPRTKAELKQFWEIPDRDYCSVFQKKPAEGRYEYYGLRYTPESIEPYLLLLKKNKLFCLGIVPLDFLYLASGFPGFSSSISGNKLRLKFFDGAGNYYTKKLLINKNTSVAREIAKILLFAQRENYLRPGAIAVDRSQPLDLNKALNAFRLSELEQLKFYSDIPLENKKPRRIRLNTSQKTALLFLSVMLILTILPFIKYNFQAGRIKRDIKDYFQRFSSIESVYNRLGEMERQSKILRQRVDQPPAVQAVAKVLAVSKLRLLNWAYDQNENLMTIVALAPGQSHNQLITRLQSLAEVENLNLIYASAKADQTEFKIILKLRKL